MEISNEANLNRVLAGEMNSAQVPCYYFIFAEVPSDHAG